MGAMEANGGSGSAAPRDDGIFATTFWTSALIVPVLVTAFVILYGFPGETRRLWAWTIHPSMTPMVMGGGYLSGAYFFLRVATVRRWHRVGVGFLATTVFTTLLLGATLLHWDKFNHGHVSFWMWLALYIVTPPLLPALWLNNRRTDPGVPDQRDTVVPAPVRYVMAAAGVGQLAVAAVMFVRPEVFLHRWPWDLTPLTARSLSAYLAFPAITWVWFLVDDRWSSFRIVVQTAALGMALIGVAALRASDDFVRSSADNWAFAVALAGAIVGLVALLASMDRRSGQAPRSSPAGTGTSSTLPGGASGQDQAGS
jgi:hypothetical protein